MDEMINNVKDIASTLAGMVAGAAGIAKTLGYDLDPSILQKINLEGIAMAVVGIFLIFGMGGKKKAV